MISWLLVSVPTLLGLILAPSTSTQTSLVTNVSVSCHFAMLGAAVGFAAHHRITGCSSSGWLAAALTLPPAAMSLMAIVRLAFPGVGRVTESPRVLFVLGGALALLWVVRAGRAHSSPSMDPVLLGFLGGAAVAAATIAITLVTTPSALLDLGLSVVALVVLVLLARPASRAVTSRTDLPVSCRLALLLGAVSLATGAATWIAPVDSVRFNLVTVSGHVVAWGSFVWVSISLLGVVTSATASRRRLAHVRAELAEHDLRQAEATLHEVRSTLAGIVSAGYLIDSPRATPLPSATVRRLTDMSRAELNRMERLLGARGSLGIHPVDLVHVTAPLLDSMRSRGHLVREHDMSTGPALGRHDEIAEAVHILLDNAARHGNGSEIEVDVAAKGDTVVLGVVNGGPSIPFALRSRMFDWGAGGPGSTGSGIGLHVARQRARNMGGDVRLASSVSGRTRFELVLLPAMAVMG